MIHCTKIEHYISILLNTKILYLISIICNNISIKASETKKMHDGVYTTEKTWKPIAYGSPFLINGDNGSLDYLHKQGFKTFHEFWDESYDHMNDVNKIKQIRDIVKKICSMDVNQINALYEKMIPILEHNRQTLIKNTQHDNLVQELSNG